MKKFFIKTILPLILMLPVVQTQLNAADISAGATCWYTQWKYDWKGSVPIDHDPDFLYGPVLTVGVTPDMNLSFVFLYGKFQQNAYGAKYTDLNRYDSDLALNYKISPMLKLFAGAKFIGIKWSDGDHYAAGPGVGLSAVIPVAGNFFLLGNFSALYLYGSEDGTKGIPYDTKAKEYGGNASISLAYYIPEASTTVSLGGRYQQIRVKYSDPLEDMVEDSTNTFYGVTLTAVYSFSI